MANTLPYTSTTGSNAAAGTDPAFGNPTSRICPILLVVDLSTSDCTHQKPLLNWGISKVAKGLSDEEQQNSITGNKFYLGVVGFSKDQALICPFTPVEKLVGKQFRTDIGGGPTLIEDAMAFCKAELASFCEKMATEGYLVADGLLTYIGDAQSSDANGKVGETVRRNGVVIEKKRRGIDPKLAEEIAQSCADKHGINYCVVLVGDEDEINDQNALQLAGGLSENIKVVDFSDQTSVSEVVGDIALAATKLSSGPTCASVDSLFGFDGRFTGTNSRDFKFEA